MGRFGVGDRGEMEMPMLAVTVSYSLIKSDGVWSFRDRAMKHALSSAAMIRTAQVRTNSGAPMFISLSLPDFSSSSIHPFAIHLGPLSQISSRCVRSRLPLTAKSQAPGMLPSPFFSSFIKSSPNV